MAPKSLPFEQKFSFLPIGSSSRHSQLYFETKILGVGAKLSLQWALKVTRFTKFDKKYHFLRSRAKSIGHGVKW